MAWLTVLVAVILALEGTLAFHKFRFDHGKNDLNFLRKHFVKKFKNVVHMDQSQFHILKMSWKNCGSSSAPAVIHNLTLTPNPVHIPGDLHVAAAVLLREDVRAPLKVELEMKKKVLFEWVKIPCFDKKIGSCTYDDVCSLMKPGPCEDPLPKYGIPCHCPFLKGQYYLPTSTFNLKSPGKSVPSWLESGDYTIKVSLSMDGKEVGCFYLELTLKF